MGSQRYAERSGNAGSTRTEPQTPRRPDVTMKRLLFLVGSQTFLLLMLSGNACGNPPRSPAGGAPPGHKSATEALGTSIKPPFRVDDQAEGLLFIWFDKAGFHNAERATDVPTAHRQHVRVDSLGLDPAKRLDPDYVYVADLRRAQGDGSYPIRKLQRSAFEALARPPAVAAPTATSKQVVIYGASWCDACQATADFFRSRNIHFEEKDIERDHAARQEMRRKLQAAGMASSNGIPVIDFRGTILQGFDPWKLERLAPRRSTL